MSSSEARILRRLGSRLRSLRLEAGISQEELAARAKMHRTYVSGIERGTRNVAAMNLVRLARALSVDPGELLVGIDKPTR